jgi:hypothetical protein
MAEVMAAFDEPDKSGKPKKAAAKKSKKGTK